LFHVYCFLLVFELLRLSKDFVALGERSQFGAQ